MPSRVPRYLRQKRPPRPDAAYTRIDGKRIYLGLYDSPESKTKYAEILRGTPKSPIPNTSNHPTVNELLVEFLRYAKEYYEQPDGAMHAHYSSFLSAGRYLRRQYGDTLAGDFGPKRLKQIREVMIVDGLSRRYVNAQVNRIRRIFKWGVVEELVPGEVSVSLSALEGLREGKSKARESPPVEPVDDSIVESTLPELSPLVADMVCIQRLTGCRPGELVRMKPSEIDRDGKVWFYMPGSHKTQYRGKQRQIPIGPRAQAILQKYLFGKWCFCASKNNPYQVTSYRIAVQRAAKRAGVEKWSPIQLRHTAATEIRREHGLEAAQVVLGHSSADITQVYAERDQAKAAEVAMRIG